MTKTCRGCRSEKNCNEFYRAKWARDGYDDLCRLCKSDESKRYYREAEQEIILKVLSWQFDNFEKVREYKRKYKLKKKNEKNNGETTIQRKRGRPFKCEKEQEVGSQS